MSSSVETFQFQAEARQVLELMIHSLYTNKEIFLRELISNASDATDRLRFEALSDPSLIGPDDRLEIVVETDSKNQTVTVHDNGIGMSRQEVIANIGTIAKSGTRELLQTIKESRSSEIATSLIGQFGVGFYSAFMVADRVTLVTRRAGEDTGDAVGIGRRWNLLGQRCAPVFPRHVRNSAFEEN
jgi:molecular chaperone HtpG